MKLPSHLTVGLLALASALAAHAADARKPLLDPAFDAVYAADKPATANGSIYQPAAGYAALTSGAQPSRVGDLITIILEEKTQATKSNSADVTHNGSIALTPPTTGPASKLFSASDIAASGSNTFKGAGDAAQSNALNGEITVTVAKVLSNGVLEVRGQKQLTLNRGDEYVQISGLIRPSDIGPDNSVSSTRVADARITYSGKGEIARASRQGWLQRFFSAISPF